jgi:lipid-binding SYLF domain-containing protein
VTTAWSEPSFICPNNLSAGFSFGLDVYNAVLILNTDAAIQGFMSYKVTVGAEVSLVVVPDSSVI